jgi:type II secretory pathway pseudopilin PulG
MGMQGVTAVELAAVMVLVTILAGAGLPTLMTSVESARFNAAVRQVAGDVRLARARAVSTGWQYRIRGRDRRGGANANQYRVEGRRGTAIAWPAETDPPQQTADLSVGPWIRITAAYPGIQLDNSGIGVSPPFYAGFDPSGRVCTPAAQCFDAVSPLRVTRDSTGQMRQIWIAPATGTVRIQ